MKAAVYYKYGSPDVVSIREINTPIPGDNEILVQVMAASLNAYDWHLVRAKPFFTRCLSGLFKPKNNIIGADIAGVVVSAGRNTTHFKQGDEVYGCLESCGKSGLATGGFAEYVCAKESVLAHKPPDISFQEAAAYPMAAVTALQGLRDNGQLKSGQSVLINGASGGVGTFAVQIAKALDAEVTAVCQTNCTDMMCSLGANSIIDYTKEDIQKTNRKYDLILDIAATLSVKTYRRLLKQNGNAVVIGFSTFSHMIKVSLASKRDNKKIGILIANNKNAADLYELNKLINTKKLTSVIDSVYPLDETAKALQHAETGHPKGKIIIRVSPE